MCAFIHPFLVSVLAPTSAHYVSRPYSATDVYHSGLLWSLAPVSSIVDLLVGFLTLLARVGERMATQTCFKPQTRLLHSLWYEELFCFIMLLPCHNTALCLVV